MRRIPAAELNFFAYRVSLMYGLPLPKLFKMILISDKTRGQYYNSCLSYSFKTKCFIKVPPFVLRTFFPQFSRMFCYAVQHMKKKCLKTGIMFSLIHVENLAIENGTITMHSKCVICPDNFQDRKLFAFRLFKYSP